MPVPSSGSAFDNILPFTLKYEGGYVNNPNDHGGATNFGITQRTYDHWRIENKLPVQDVKLISNDEVHAIYKEEYWNLICTHTPSIPLLLCTFDSAVLHGPARALKWLQACNNNIDTFCNFRAAFMNAIAQHDPTQQRFLAGWLHRNELVRGVAHSWAA